MADNVDNNDKVNANTDSANTAKSNAYAVADNVDLVADNADADNVGSVKSLHLNNVDSLEPGMTNDKVARNPSFKYQTFSELKASFEDQSGEINGSDKEEKVFDSETSEKSTVNNVVSQKENNIDKPRLPKTTLKLTLEKINANNEIKKVVGIIEKYDKKNEDIKSDESSIGRTGGPNPVTIEDDAWIRKNSPLDNKEIIVVTTFENKKTELLPDKESECEPKSIQDESPQKEYRSQSCIEDKIAVYQQNSVENTDKVKHKEEEAAKGNDTLEDKGPMPKSEEVLEAKKQEILTLEERKQSLWEQKEDLEERNSKLKELKNNFEKIRESLDTERINLDEKLREKQSAFSSLEVIKVMSSFIITLLTGRPS